jgi:hypothetical protein
MLHELSRKCAGRSVSIRLERSDAIRTDHSIIPGSCGVAHLHPPLCFVLVNWFQLVSEHHSDDRLSPHNGTASGFDVGRLGNEARQTKLDPGNSRITRRSKVGLSIGGPIGGAAVFRQLSCRARPGVGRVET